MDPYHKLLPGLLYAQLKSDYPAHVELQTTSIPEEMAGGLAQHQSRRSAEQWPLVQVGPGLLTVNETEGYEWDDFGQRAENAVAALYEAYPRPDQLVVESLMLRYIDAVDFDHNREDVYAFLSDKMRVTVALPPSLFENVRVDETVRRFLWTSSFRCEEPASSVTVKFATGAREERPSLVWETLVHSEGENAPGMADGFGDWLQAAHALTHDWFFKLIDGELLRRFSDDQ